MFLFEFVLIYSIFVVIITNCLMSDFRYRIILDDDYKLLCSWWKAWSFPCPPRECLPKNGLIVCDEEGPLYAGFLFFTDSNIAWMEWIVSNKEASPERKRGALDYLVFLFSEMAKGAGVRYVFTSTVRTEFVNSLRRCGFDVGDKGVYQLIKNL